PLHDALPISTRCRPSSCVALRPFATRAMRVHRRPKARARQLPEQGYELGRSGPPAPRHRLDLQTSTQTAIGLELIAMALNKDEILDAVAGLTVLELSELIKMMEEKFGVSAAAAAVAVAAPAGGGGGAAAPAEEQTEFT